MPGGSSFRQWYAVRERLRREGRWGNHPEDPSESSPRPPKRTRRSTPEGELPEGGESSQEAQKQVTPAPTPEGKTPPIPNPILFYR